MTRRPIPVEQKRLTGRSPGRDAGGRRLPAPVTILPAPAEIPPPPEQLGASGRRHWQRIWEEARAWLGAVDAGTCERYCMLWDWRALMVATVVDEGFIARGSMRQASAHPLLRRIEAIDAELRLLEGRLGLDPCARSALGVAEVRRISKLDEMMRRQKEG